MVALPGAGAAVGPLKLAEVDELATEVGRPLTLIAGSVTPGLALWVLGYQTTPREIRALIHFQKYMGHLLGVRMKWYPETIGDSVRMLLMTILSRSHDSGEHGRELIESYPKAFESSWLHDELYRARNFKPAMNKGLWLGTLLVGIDQVLFKGKAPFTLHVEKPDHEYLRPASECTPIEYPKPDGKLTFDKLSSVFISNTNHEENQPVHLTLKDPSVPVDINLRKYAGPEQRYCPAGVYEFVKDEATGADRLQINAQNCVHCKTCDIKDPTQNIVWVTPEGGGGPNYSGM